MGSSSVLVMVTVISQLVVAYGIENIFRGIPFEECIADHVIVAGETWNAGLVLGNLMLFMVFHECKNDFRPTALLRYATVEAVCRKQKKSLIRNSVCMSMASVFSVTLFSCLRGTISMNWNNGRSFFRVNYGVLSRVAHLWEVVLSGVIGQCILLSLIGMVALIVLWFGWKPIYAFLVMNGIWVLEICCGSHIFHNLLRVRQEMWLEPYMVAPLLILTILVIMCECMLLRVAIRRREYL